MLSELVFKMCCVSVSVQDPGQCQSSVRGGVLVNSLLSRENIEHRLVRKRIPSSGSTAVKNQLCIGDSAVIKLKC